MERYVDGWRIMANKVPEKLWIHLIADFIMKLPLVAEKNVVLVVYNKLSKIFCGNNRGNINEETSKVVQEWCMKAA